ncbi:uncharacterized protein LOC131007706 isoform X1 [Salvia miltiorrhiza]|uniref:uncharacterized protein LOC131007706 isoform X1 n=1 Tax=Salvia miltiorrhiza TaxID=226208 RepID=UPI0025ACDC89|nr:uncharacterized protein LOC131007706 isoform X1 [Salvia miltiorrhiza]
MSLLLVSPSILHQLPKEIWKISQAAPLLFSKHGQAESGSTSTKFFKIFALFGDRLPQPYANNQDARFANGGAYPPNLSLITKIIRDHLTRLPASMKNVERFIMGQV